MPFLQTMPLEDILDEDAPARCARKIADAGGDRLHDMTRRFTPVDRSPFRDTPRPRGAARASVQRTAVEMTGATLSRYTVRVFSDDPIFPFIEFTTKPHIIRPRADRRPATVVETRKPRGTVKDGRAALSWRGPGGRFFAKEVHHPGTQGQHPFSRAALQTEAAVNRLAAGPLREFEHDLVNKVR